MSTEDAELRLEPFVVTTRDALPCPACGFDSLMEADLAIASADSLSVVAHSTVASCDRCDYQQPTRSTES